MTPPWLPSISYTPAHTGYWEPVTSTINWCEEVCTSYIDRHPGKLLTAAKDYYASPYAAEIVNTFTNLVFILLALKGIVSCRKHGHDFIFLVAFVGYLLVGSGSFLFHATLKCS